MSLEGAGPAIGRPPRRRGMELNHHPAFFKRVREPSLLPRQNWLRDQELHLATPAYEAGSTLGLPALRNLVAAVGYDPTRSRQSARSRALIRRTRSPEVLAATETDVVELGHAISHAGFSRRTAIGLSSRRPWPPLIDRWRCRLCPVAGVVAWGKSHRRQQLFQNGRALPPGSAGLHAAWPATVGLACPLRGDVVEASTVAVEHRLLASKLLPALHRNIDISRRDFNRVAHPAGHLSRDYRRARAAERLVDGLPGRRIILDRPAHALDRLLRAVAGFRFQIFVDLPQRRLRMAPTQDAVLPLRTTYQHGSCLQW